MSFFFVSCLHHLSVTSTWLVFKLNESRCSSCLCPGPGYLVLLRKNIPLNRFRYIYICKSIYIFVPGLELTMLSLPSRHCCLSYVPAIIYITNFFWTLSIFYQSLLRFLSTFIFYFLQWLLQTLLISSKYMPHIYFPPPLYC